MKKTSFKKLSICPLLLNYAPKGPSEDSPIVLWLYVIIFLFYVNGRSQGLSECVLFTLTPHM